MFKKHSHHLQIQLTSNIDKLSEKLRKRLENSCVQPQSARDNSNAPKSARFL
jgi:hypothetical protein